jgi:hypothetical protein
MATELTINTWTCDTCGYMQDFDPQGIARHFPEVPANHCPACFTGSTKNGNRGKSLLRKETDTDKKIRVAIKDEADLAKERVRTENGNERPLNGQELAEARKQIAAAHEAVNKIKD